MSHVHLPPSMCSAVSCMFGFVQLRKALLDCCLVIFEQYTTWLIRSRLHSPPLSFLHMVTDLYSIKVTVDKGSAIGKTVPTASSATIGYIYLATDYPNYLTQFGYKITACQADVCSKCLANTFAEVRASYPQCPKMLR